MKNTSKKQKRQTKKTLTFDTSENKGLLKKQRFVATANIDQQMCAFFKTTKTPRKDKKEEKKRRTPEETEIEKGRCQEGI